MLGRDDLRVSLDGLRVAILCIGGERIERVPESALPDEFNGGSAHPLDHVECLGSALNA